MTQEKKNPQAQTFSMQELDYIEQVSRDILDICGKGMTEEQIRRIKKQITLCGKLKAKINAKR